MFDKDRGFVVVGVHTAEFARERDGDNVRREVARLGITYPVHHFGEGYFEEQDKVLAGLLAARDAARTPGDR